MFYNKTATGHLQDLDGLRLQGQEWSTGGGRLIARLRDAELGNQPLLPTAQDEEDAHTFRNIYRGADDDVRTGKVDVQRNFVSSLSRHSNRYSFSPLATISSLPNMTAMGCHRRATAYSCGCRGLPRGEATGELRRFKGRG